MRRIRPRSAYDVLALISFFLVIGGGTALASYVVSSNSEIGPNTVSGHHPPPGSHANVITGSLNAQDLATGAVTGGKLAAGSVGTAKFAPSATAPNATHAANASHATTADSATTANAAYSTSHGASPILFPDTLNGVGNPIATLTIPQAGSYVIDARLVAFQAGTAAPGHASSCQLAAGADDQNDAFSDLTGDQADHFLQVAHTFSSPGTATLSCFDGGVPANEEGFDIRLTAIQVASLTDTGF